MRSDRTALWVMAVALCAVVSISGAAFGQSAQSKPAGAAVMEPYGVGTHMNELKYYELAKQAGVQWIRLDISWYHVEKEQGKWTFEAADAAIDKANQLGLKVLVILGKATSWSCSAPKDGEKIRESTLVSYAPREECEKAYQEYIRTVVTRYKDKVGAWELHNEIDHYGFLVLGPGCWAENHLKEAGKDEKRRRQYMHQVELAMEVLKPMGVTVTTSGFAMGGSCDKGGAEWMLRQPGFLAQFDVLNVHAYGWPKHESIVNRIKLVMGIEKEMGVSRPVWLTEHGIPGLKPETVDAAKAKSFMLKSYALAMGLGVDKVFWYRLTPGGSKHVSMLNAKMQPSMIADAYKLMTQQWAQPVKFAAWSGKSLEGTIATLADGRRVMMLWSKTADPAELDGLPGKVVKVVDMDGQELELSNMVVATPDPIFVHLEGK